MKKIYEKIIALFSVVAVSFCFACVLVLNNDKKATSVSAGGIEDIIAYDVGLKDAEENINLTLNKCYCVYFSSFFSDNSIYSFEIDSPFIQFSDVQLFENALGVPFINFSRNHLSFGYIKDSVKTNFYNVTITSSNFESFDESLFFAYTSDTNLVSNIGVSVFVRDYVTSGKVVYSNDYQNYLVLSSYITSLETAISNLEETIVDLRAEITDLEEQIDYLTGLYQDATDDLEGYAEQVWLLNEQINMKESLIANLEETITDLELELRDNMTIIETLTASTDVFSLINGAFGGIIPLLDLELAPNISIGMLLTLPFVFAIIGFAIKLIG